MYCALETRPWRKNMGSMAQPRNVLRPQRVNEGEEGELGKWKKTEK